MYENNLLNPSYVASCSCSAVSKCRSVETHSAAGYLRSSHASEDDLFLAITVYCGHSIPWQNHGVCASSCRKKLLVTGSAKVSSTSTNPIPAISSAPLPRPAMLAFRRQLTTLECMDTFEYMDTFPFAED